MKPGLRCAPLLLLLLTVLSPSADCSTVRAANATLSEQAFSTCKIIWLESYQFLLSLEQMQIASHKTLLHRRLSAARAANRAIQLLARLQKAIQDLQLTDTTVSQCGGV
ncbi:hypothetical protein BOX15_Mlig019343g1 [Macrostomum lignano]|uniref:Uncharacterized protein n=1 Tax=Macrostomum lignano TaxID=282301 RepID=A0A267FN05_9PLAT|nr:hypothetical protein BOX15_Mlig019343g1 [Macrostomum lignano]